LQRYRAWLHTIRHIEEAASELKTSRNALPPVAASFANDLLNWMQTNILLGAEATSSMDPQKIQLFFESSKQKVPSVRALRNASLENCEGFSPVGKLEMSSLVDNFDITAWLIHRLSKLQMMRQ
jgi:hypothetical protein